MRIKEITNEYIAFDDGSLMTYHHYQDCCEYNYADFSYIREEPGIYIFDFDKDLIFEPVDGSGFRFGSGKFMVFVPCYSDQNGYYSSDIDIYFRGEPVLSSLDCKWIETY